MTIQLNPIRKNLNVLSLPMGDLLFSYKTPVAFYEMNTGNFYRTQTKYSTTTSKHINQWLRDRNALERATEKPQQFFDELTGFI
jgi:hypothetical protein